MELGRQGERNLCLYDYILGSLSLLLHVREPIKPEESMELDISWSFILVLLILHARLSTKPDKFWELGPGVTSNTC